MRMKLIFVALGALLAAWLAFSWFEAEREIRILCSQFHPGLDRERVVRMLDTGEYLRYRPAAGSGDPAIIVDSLYNLRYSRCVIEFEAGRVASAGHESRSGRTGSEPRQPPAAAPDHHWAVVFYLQPAHGGIEELRQRHDPTAELVRAHITVVFPIPGTVARGDLVEHIEGALARTDRFQIRLGGFDTAHDHWLLLTLSSGQERFRELHSLLYTGVLEEFRRQDLDYTPHVGLGLFLRQGVTYDWENPRESDFDQARHSAALEEARALDLGQPMLVEELHLVALPSEVIDWASGKRPDLPADARVRDVRVFRLGD